ncbi:unnamed protein product [Oppiella nova]|uniref:Uncharacterized protein n=1 Tax=Oppiella nova TaxID=334625 RepID=A0A7R9LMQ4_9ACAR|nr:unnamed protein product [Oppiella nova]CAG2165187.1 unnamed protein product [Oppiella nova]
MRPPALQIIYFGTTMEK